jgi:hypothetical protein
MAIETDISLLQTEVMRLKQMAKRHQQALSHLLLRFPEAVEEREPGELCDFSIAWVGRCKNRTPCPDHDRERCFLCHGRATGQCDHAGQFVCGTPTCDDHNHSH